MHLFNSCMSYLCSFAYLDQYSPRWERFTTESPTYACLESSQVHKAYQTHLLAFWNRLLPELNELDQISPGGTTLSTTYPSTGDPTTEQQSELL